MTEAERKTTLGVHDSRSDGADWAWREDRRQSAPPRGYVRPKQKRVFMVAERYVSRPTPPPAQTTSEAMASTRTTGSEASAQTPAREPRDGEEQEEPALTPISANGSTPLAERSERSPHASDISGFGT